MWNHRAYEPITEKGELKTPRKRRKSGKPRRGAKWTPPKANPKRRAEYRSARRGEGEYAHEQY